MQTRTKAAIGGLAVLVVAAGATVALRAREVEEPLAQLDVARQSVNVERAGATASAAAHDELAIGDRITTDAQGLGTVNWFDGSLTRLGGDADFVVQALSSENGGRQIVGKLNFGESWHRVEAATGSGSRFEVQTPNAIASVRGTSFLVRCIPTCRYGVAEGQVQVVTEDGDTALIDGGEQVEEDENGDLGPIEPLDTEDPWLQMNQELDSELDESSGAGDDEGESDAASEGDETGDEADATTASTAPPTTAAPSPSGPPTSAAPFTPRSRTASDTSDDDGDPAPANTTSTGTIPPPPPPPPPPAPPAPPSPPTSEPAPATTAPPTSTPPTSTPPTSAPPSTAPERTTSSTTPSTTAPTTSTTAAPTTTTPPTTSAPPTTAPPSPPTGGGSGPVQSPPTTAAPTTTSTTEAPPETGSISGTVSEPNTTTDPSSEVTARAALMLTAAGTAVACPHGATGEVTCFGEAIVDGAFTIADVPAGKYDVFAAPPEGRSDLAVSSAVLVELAAGEHEEGVALVYELAESLFELSGVVYDGVDGPVVAGASVVVYPPCDCSGFETTTNSDGFYSLSLPDGDYLIEVAKEGFEPASTTATISGAAVTQDFHLAEPPPPEFDLTGTATDSGGAPLQGASVLVYPGACVECGHLHALTTDAEGLYSVSLPAGDYEVSAGKSGFRSQTVTVTIVDAPVTQDFTLALEPIFCICPGGLTPAPEPETDTETDTVTLTSGAQPLRPSRGRPPGQ